MNDVEHLESRNGKGWARFTVEDFTDQYEFRIFGEDYLKYQTFSWWSISLFEFGS